MSTTGRHGRAVETLLDELACALMQQASSDERASMQEAGYFPFLVALAGEKQPEVRKAQAAEAMVSLTCMGMDLQARNALVDAGAAPPMVAMLAAGVESRAAATAARALCYLSNCSEAQKEAIFEAGAVPLLLPLLAVGVESDAAAMALCYLACGSQTRKQAIFEAGAVPPLVSLLRAGAESEAARLAALALGHLANGSETRSTTIVEAGAVPLLVALLGAGAESTAARRAAYALGNLAKGSEARSTAIVEAGAVPHLVAMLAAGAESTAAKHAAFALGWLVDHDTQHATAALVLSTLRQKAISVSGFADLQSELQEAVQARLSAAVEGTDCARLKEVIEEARLVKADGAQLAAAQARLDELTAAALAAKRARREFVGLGNAEPADFICPLTLDVMQDPVVASDGHSYERAAIQDVLSSANKRSPLTREALTDVLVPNRALRRRIEERVAALDRTRPIALTLAVPCHHLPPDSYQAYHNPRSTTRSWTGWLSRWWRGWRRRPLRRGRRPRLRRR